MKITTDKGKVMVRRKPSYLRVKSKAVWRRNMGFSKYGRRRPNYLYRDNEVFKNDGLLGYRKILPNGELEKKYYSANMKPIKAYNEKYK